MGAISPAMRQAGEVFHQAFHRAHLDPLKAADMTRVTISGGRSPRDEPSSVEAAKRRVHAVLEAIFSVYP